MTYRPGPGNPATSERNRIARDRASLRRAAARPQRCCPWAGPSASDDVDPASLCRWHLAEYEGLSVAELDRWDAETAAEEADLYA